MEQFNFRIIKAGNGAEIIDNTLSTPYNSLTSLQMMDYINVENSLYFAERQKRWQKGHADFIRVTYPFLLQVMPDQAPEKGENRPGLFISGFQGQSGLLFTKNISWVHVKASVMPLQKRLSIML